MKNLGYYNGKFDELENMTVPMTDRACYFGDGIYDFTYARNYKLFSLDEHVVRFFNNAAKLRLNLTVTPDGLKSLLTDLVSKVDTGNVGVYWQASRATALRAHVFPENATANLWIMIKPGKINEVYRPFRCILLDDTRFFHCDIKTLNLLPSVMAAQRADEAGCDEAILHRMGRVTECSHSNVSMLKDGVLRTAPTDNLILPGIGRRHLIEKCREFGIPVVEIPFTTDELMDADEVIITSSTTLCARVLEIAGKAVGGRDGETVRRLQDALYADYTAATAE